MSFGMKVSFALNKVNSQSLHQVGMRSISPRSKLRNPFQKPFFPVTLQDLQNLAPIPVALQDRGYARAYSPTMTSRII